MEQRFVVLDSWRGIAACLVALFHLDAYSHFYALPLLRNSWLFVDFFFVLSGFIIASNYQRRLLEGYGTGRFLLLRLGRLYPLHLAMLALFILFDVLKLAGRALMPGAVSPAAVAPFSTAAEAPSTIIANLALTQGLHEFDFLTWNFPSWSISTEFYTYVLFALCLALLRNRARLLLPVALIGGPLLIGLLSEQTMSTTYDWGIIRCIYGFAAGVMVAQIYRRGERIRRWLAVRPIGNAAEWGALGMVVFFVSVADKSNPLSIAAPYVFGFAVLVFACEAGSASALLRRRSLVFLGTVSYSIYMTHVFVEQRLFDATSVINKLLHLNLFTHRSAEGLDLSFLGSNLWQGDIAYLVYLPLVLAMSYCTYHWIERPARQWVRARVQRAGPAIAMGQQAVL